MTPEHTFESILGDLLQAKVDFILVGGLAVELCGFTRATLDVDILIEDSEANIARLIGSLRSFADGVTSELTVADFPPEEGCIRIVDEFALAIFTRMTGRSYHVGQFRDRQKWTCFKLETPDSDRSIYAYAPAGSDLSKRIQTYVMKSRGFRQHMTLKIKSVNSSGKDALFVVDELLAMGWVRE